MAPAPLARFGPHLLRRCERLPLDGRLDRRPLLSDGGYDLGARPVGGVWRVPEETAQIAPPDAGQPAVPERVG